MKKLILIDGNNLMFRSYYATAYNGNFMKNSKNFPTNALYGFVSMLNKIMTEEKPRYMAVAFDVGKNFRKEEFSFYKEGRIGIPEELKMQMPIARKILDAMNIKHFELEPFEADDIIGTIVKMTENDPEFSSTIISSDKDLLQLISKETEVKLLKQSGFIRYTKEKFWEDYKIEPIKIIDLKALMGDASDNIPGVKGIGEKTALKLIQEFGSLTNLYENIDQVKGKNKEKLINDQENAFMSQKIATIYQDVPLNIELESLKIQEINQKQLNEIYQELEFFSFLNKTNEIETDLEFKEINDINELNLKEPIYLYLELDKLNYHQAKALGLTIKDQENIYYINPNIIDKILLKVKNLPIITYDAKKINGYLKSKINCIFDLSIAAYLENYNVKDDIAYLMNQFNYQVMFFDKLVKDFSNIKNELVLRVSFIEKYYHFFKKKLEENNHLDLFEKIEMPLIKVLSDMEINGIKVDKSVLEKMKEEIFVKIELVSEEIYELAGKKFNISSPKQLGVILFEELEIGKGKKNKTGYKTDVKVLEKLINKHPIVEKILLHRNLSKIYSTYIEGLEQYILDDQKIHTIFKQTLTKTGRLSSTEPNLQNIPIKEELGRNIRKAFLPTNDLFLSADYSQIELRILAHITNCEALIKAFQNDEDIHTVVASDIYEIPIEAVTKEMRRTAKAVIFGIVYGISGFGLGENLNINKKEAEEFIQKYYKLYPEVKNYMDEIITKTKELGYVETLFKRKRIIEEINNPNYLIRNMGERMALNTPIQGTSADIMKMAMIKVWEKMYQNNLKSKLLLQIHDEIIIDCIESELELVKTLVKESMEQIYNLKVPLKVSIDTGLNWYETK
ncbi:MAG: DNA polymerase I [Firmicutes bacterium]|nr:DNA polymerase I [Bacillota bacterium]